MDHMAEQGIGPLWTKGPQLPIVLNTDRKKVLGKVELPGQRGITTLTNRGQRSVAFSSVIQRPWSIA